LAEEAAEWRLVELADEEWAADITPRLPAVLKRALSTGKRSSPYQLFVEVCCMQVGIVFLVFSFLVPGLFYYCSGAAPLSTML
jgi:hypothetical protein